MTVLPKYEQRQVPFAAWIIRVARNVGVDHLRQRRAIPCEEVRELRPQPRATTTPSRPSLALREALAALPGRAARGRRAAPRRRADARRDRRPARARPSRSIHGLHHRGRGALRSDAGRARVRALRSRAEGRGLMATHRPAAGELGRSRSRGSTARTPRCSRSCSRSSAASRRRGAFTMGHELEAFEAEFAAYCETESRRRRVARAPRRSCSRCARSGSAPATRSSSRRTRSSRPRRRSASSARPPRLVDVDPGDAPAHRRARSQAAIGPRTRCVIPVHLLGSTVDMDPLAGGGARGRPPRDRGLRAGARRPLPRAARRHASATWAASRSTRRRTSAPGATAARS